MLQAGQVLHERYKLQQKLGQNAGRQTWLAEDLTAHPAGELVIVKLLSFGGDVQWDDLKLFEREAQVLKQLSHPRIPKYRDYFSIDDRTLWFGLVQEYIPGSSFKELLNQGKRFTESELRKIAEEILKILVYLHELNPPVLHRDIKPSNLIWGEDKRVYLVDFGAVQDKAAAEGATFTVVGTYGYAPVEQFGGRAVPASDLYALGATLIHLATGTSPADLPQRDMRIQFSDRVSLSPSFSSWIEHLTEPALEERLSSAFLALNGLVSGQYSRTSNRQLMSLQSTRNHSGEGGLFNRSVPVPDEIKGWNWGAFLAAPIWALSHRVFWSGLLSLPLLLKSISFLKLDWQDNCFYVSPWEFWGTLTLYLLMALGLGSNGNEWAWKSKKWESIEAFKASQRVWAIAGAILVTWMCLMTFVILALVAPFVSVYCRLG
jgi:serine/threonine protein kinase